MTVVFIQLQKKKTWSKELKGFLLQKPFFFLLICFYRDIFSAIINDFLSDN